MGSIRLAPDLTEIDHIPEQVRLKAGDIVLTAALIQQQLAELFSEIIGVIPAIFTYLGHNLDTSQTRTALMRLIKSDDVPVETSATLIQTLKKCDKVLQKRNKIAHNPMVYVDNMLMRFEVEGGNKPHRVAKGLGLHDFEAILLEMKDVLWSLRLEVTELRKRRSAQTLTPET